MPPPANEIRSGALARMSIERSSLAAALRGCCFDTAHGARPATSCVPACRRAGARSCDRSSASARCSSRPSRRRCTSRSRVGRLLPLRDARARGAAGARRAASRARSPRSACGAARRARSCTALAPERRLYLFDTFKGFPQRDLPPGADDALPGHQRRGGAPARRAVASDVVLRPGYVPDTLAGLEDETFAFVLLDLDLLDADRRRRSSSSIRGSSPGGYLVIHDYNNPESDWACKRALRRVPGGQARAGRRARRRVGLGADPPARLTPADPAPDARAALRAGRGRRPHARVLPLPAAGRARATRCSTSRRRCRTSSTRADALRAVGVENWVAPRPASPLEEVGPRRGGRAGGARRGRRRGRCARSRCASSGPGCARWPSGRSTSGGPTWWSSATTWRPPGPATCRASCRRCSPATTSPGAGTSRARRARRPARARLLRAEAARYRRHVLRVLPRFDTAVAVSTLEAEELRRHRRTRVELIPTGVDTRELRPAPEQPGPPRLLFTGTMSYPPNHQGIRWFAREVWPLVRAAAARCAARRRRQGPARRGASRSTGATASPFTASSIRWRRTSPRAHAVVVPILAGAGIRVKIVEAMAAGRAVVSTPLGCEGLAGLEPGRHLLVAEEPPAFAGADRAAARRSGGCAGGWPPTPATLAEARLRLAGARRPARARPRGAAAAVIHVGPQPRLPGPRRDRGHGDLRPRAAAAARRARRACA